MSNGGGQFKSFGPFFSSAGVIYRGIKINVYAAGTTTNKTYWTDENKATPGAFPLEDVDQDGVVVAFFDGDYRFQVKDSAGVDLDDIIDWDNVKVTSDMATMWEANHGTAYPAATSANKWQLFALHDASDNFKQLGINKGSAFVPSGIRTDLSLYADLATAISTIGATPTTLQISSVSAVSANAIVPKTLILDFVDAGRLDPDSGITITINSNTGRWEQRQVFGGVGAILIGGEAGVVFAEWWGIDGTADDVQIQQAIDSIAAVGGVVELLSKTYNTTAPIVVGNNMTVRGHGRNATNVTKTGGTTYTTIIGARTKDSVFTMDAATGAFVFESRVMDMTLTPSDLTGSYGIYLNATSQSVFKFLNVQGGDYAIGDFQSWMIEFSNIRGGSQNVVSFDFSQTNAKTSLNFSNIYVEASAAAFDFFGVTYSSMRAIGTDYINTGGRPGNPYGADAKGSYTAIGYTFVFNACQVTLDGAGSEHSGALFMYLESSRIVLNDCDILSSQIDYDSAAITTKGAFIGLRGVTTSILHMNACEVSVTNNITASTYMNLYYVENALSRIYVDDLEIDASFGAFNNVGNIIDSSMEEIFDDPEFAQRDAGVAPLGWQLKNGSGFSSDSTIRLNLDSAGDGTTHLKILEAIPSTSSGGNTINNYWLYTLPKRQVRNKIIRIFVEGTHSSGGFGNVQIGVFKSPTHLGVMTLVGSAVTLAVPFSEELVVTMPDTTDFFYFGVLVTFAGSYAILDRLHIRVPKLNP